MSPSNQPSVLLLRPSMTLEPPAIRLVKNAFKVATYRDPSGVPRVAADFVAEQGQLVRILDVRDEGEMVGSLGHIPAVTHVALAHLGEVPDILDRETCVVMVSRRGGRAGVAARMLEELGMQRVAAMEGGMTAWKQLGFATLRGPSTYRKELVALAPGVGRDGTPLVAVEPGAQVTAEQIADHVGEPTAVRWVKLGAFLVHGKRSCVDGRDAQGVIGTPGGDAGELLLALAAIERLSGGPLPSTVVERVLVDHVDTFGRFYMHSDVAAMSRLVLDGYRNDARIAPHIKHIDTGDAWRRFHIDPPTALREAMLEHLVRPQNMGCGHLQLAMTNPDYAVSPQLAVAFLEAFHRVRWSGAPELEWVILGGSHEEGAVANVCVEGSLHSYTRIPLVSPNVGGVQLFVNHPQVTTYLRRELAAFLVESRIADIREDQLVDTIESLGTLQASRTLGAIARNLPVFDIRFDQEDRATVEQRGTIGA